MKVTKQLEVNILDFINAYLACYTKDKSLVGAYTFDKTDSSKISWIQALSS